MGRWGAVGSAGRAAARILLGGWRARPARLDIDTGRADSAERAAGAPCPADQWEKKS